MVKNAAIRDENDPRIAKLPRYARDYIKQLCREVSQQKALVAEVVGQSVDWGERERGKAYVQMPGDDGYRVIAQGSKVVMPLGDDFAEMRVDGDELNVMTGEPMSVRPQVSNVVRISGGRRGR